MRYRALYMNTKTIVIGLVVIIALAVGGYFIYTSKGTATPPQNDSQTAAIDQTKVQGQDVKVGTGREAKEGDTVSVLYEGKFTDGTVFDSSAAHGNQPLVFVLGTQGIIAGFQIGVNGMKEGGERLLAIPATLGYGTADFKDPTTGKVLIPANSTLIFNVKLVKVETTASTTAPATN